MDRKLLDILCCPISKQPLALLTGPQLAALNRAIAGGGVFRADGSPQSGALGEGLLTQDRQQAYRIEDGIPVLLGDEAIAVSQISDFPQ